jgi:hypothetical protein
MDHRERFNVSPWDVFPEFEELLVDDAMFNAFIGDEPIAGFDISSEAAIPSRFTELDDELDLANEPQTAPSALPVPRDRTTDPGNQQAVELAIPHTNQGTVLGPRRYFVPVIY